MKRPALVLSLCAFVACTAESDVATPRRETLQILAESPEFDGELPFGDVGPTDWGEALVYGDDRTVVLRYMGGNTHCWGADHVEARYEEDRIVLTLYDGVVELGPREACTLEGRTRSVTVRLSEPVLNRELVDGAPGRHGP